MLSNLVTVNNANTPRGWIHAPNSGAANVISSYSAAASAPSGKAKQLLNQPLPLWRHGHLLGNRPINTSRLNTCTQQWDQRCYEIAHTVLVAGTFSGFISGTKMSTQAACNEQFYESVFGSSSSQRRLIIQVHLCILYDCDKY
jgi:hypothetical protein